MTRALALVFLMLAPAADAAEAEVVNGRVVTARVPMARVVSVGDTESTPGQAAANWTSFFDAAYFFENAAGGAAIDDAGANDLTDVGTVARGSSAPVPQGTQYADLLDSVPNSFLCTAATCPVFAYVTNWTICGWFMALEAEDDTVVDRLTALSGYRLQRANLSNALEGIIGDGADLQTSVYSGTLTWPTAAWRHNCIKFNDPSDIGRLNLNGEQSIVTVAQQDTGDAAISLTVGAQLGGVTAAFTGRMDELLFIAQTMALDEMCRVCSCGVAGQLCMCDATTPANYKACGSDTDCRVSGNATALCFGGLCTGRNNAAADPDCQNCTLPACNTASP